MLAVGVMCICLAAAWRLWAVRQTAVLPLRVAAISHQLPADGSSFVPVEAHGPDGERVPVTARVLEGQRNLRIDGNRLRTTPLPGRAVVELRAAGFRPTRIAVETRESAADRFEDGTPDFLRLDTAPDRKAFRSRFAAIAELQATRSSGSLPKEVNDCAGLVRYAYRESFRETCSIAMAPPEKWMFPYTPLGANLFRITGGRYSADDVAAQGFAEFADAETLLRYNTYRVTRNVDEALPGDLLFYRQLNQRMPFHVMIVLQRTPEEPSGAAVYHTGPIQDQPGEIRRPALSELLNHPLPQWRPAAGNPNFLGVYRWNILKEELP
jgi:uncharacterized protein YfaT (DUF1175 family)